MRGTTAARIAVFDLDGTLTDSQAGIVASYRHTLHAFGLDAEPDAIRPWLGPPLMDGLAALGVPPGCLETAVATYRAYFSAAGMYENQLYDGAAELVATLRSAGYTLAVATSKLGEFAETILEHFGLAAEFTLVAGATRDGRRVHKGDILAGALEGLGSPRPDLVAMVGDREHDMFAAVEHGLLPVGALWGYGSRAELIAAGAEVLAASPRELARLMTGSSFGRPVRLGPGR